ncbi:MAG: hypothetical protein KBT02_01530 [Treponema sp.]|nr:hypothetical protein [Candidatus Treponema caballi]
MKKFISALLVLTVLFCFTACKHEPDSTPTPDLTTLDGMYVTTLTISGKPCNWETLVISGNTATLYGMMADTSLAGLNAATQEIEDTETIVRNGLSFTIEGDTNVYTLEVQDGVGIIVLYGMQYMKVLPGELGESIGTMEFYHSEAGNVISVLTFDLGAGSLTQMSLVVAENEVYSGFATIIGNTYSVTSDGDNFSFSVEFSGSTATLTSHDGFATTPASTYTKYVRTTPWPTVSAN